MINAAIHRRWAREFLDRAQQAQTRSRKLQYLRLAVNNSVRAQAMEAGGSQASMNSGAEESRPRRTPVAGFVVGGWGVADLLARFLCGVLDCAAGGFDILARALDRVAGGQGNGQGDETGQQKAPVG
jgi:hypothetical protein